jgi:hypothetical protein
MMADLSPAAKAVLEAANGACCFGPGDILNDSRFIAAATLRAAADQVVPHEEAPPLLRGHELERLCQRQHTRAQLLAMADELKDESNA